jgi:hypothetical protein
MGWGYWFGPSTPMPVWNTEYKVIVPSSTNWRIEPVEYFHLYFDFDLLALIFH